MSAIGLALASFVLGFVVAYILAANALKGVYARERRLETEVEDLKRRVNDRG